MAKRPVPKYDFKAFGAAIKEARKGRKESRKKVSDEMYISPRYLANIENKGQHPSLQIFYELVARYNISVDQFFFPDNEAEKSTQRRQLDTLLDNMSDAGLRICLLYTSLQEHPVLTGPPVGQRHHQVVVLILVPEHLFQFVLGLLPFQQNVGQSLGQPHFADTGIGLWLLQDDPGAGVGKQGREHIVDIPMPQHLNGPLGGPRQRLCLHRQGAGAGLQAGH